VEDDLRRGAVFYDLQRSAPARLDLFTAAIRVGRGNVLNRRLFGVEATGDGTLTVRQPALFLDLVPAPAGTPVPDDSGWPDRDAAEQALLQQALTPFREEVAAGRMREVETIARHLEISLNAVIDRAQQQWGDLQQQKDAGSREPGLEGRLKQSEDRLDELNARLERRRKELAQERHCTIADVHHHGRAWVLPHPERLAPAHAAMVSDPGIERIAVEAVEAYEQAQGRMVESVEALNRGFDLISRRMHPEDPRTATEVRFIEVKGRAGVGEVALSGNEYRTAERLKDDYWLYVVYNCATQPTVHVIRNPARLGWQPVMAVAHYVVKATEILGQADA
jgi:hypothetical protein